MYLSRGDSAASWRIGVLGGVDGSAGLEDSFSIECCLPPSVGIPRLGLVAGCSCPLDTFDLGGDARLGILFLVSTGEDATGIPVFETFRVDFSAVYPGILLPWVASPGLGIPLALGVTGKELGGDLAGILDPPGVGTFDSTVLFTGVEGIVGMRDWFTAGPSGSVTLEPPGVGSLDSFPLLEGVVGVGGIREWLEAGSSCFGVVEGDFVNEGIRLTPMGIPVPCCVGAAPGILLLVESLTGERTSAVPFCVGGSSFWLSFRATEGILDLGMADLLKDGILLSCLTGSCPFVFTVGSLFSLDESGLFFDSAEDAVILLAGLSFCKALSLRPVEGIWDLLTASCPLSPLFMEGILLPGGVRSSVTCCFAREGIRETCESDFSALDGERTRDGILDISVLLPDLERLSSIELFEGDLFNVLEVKLLLLEDLLISPSVFS